jgi:two-component system, OmpR family, response regulator
VQKAALVTAPATGPLVLIVDDDAHIRDVLRYALAAAGFRTAEAADGAQALVTFAAQRPDLVVLDVMMPEMDGTEVCRRLRAESKVPIVFLSSRDEDVDRIVGLELGGDDYIGKPFSPREVVARVRAVLRRGGEAGPATGTAASAAGARKLQHGSLTLDLDRFQVTFRGALVTLTATEFGILRTLMGYPGKVFTRDELMAAAYDGETVVSDRTIDSHVRRVRQKMAAGGSDPIVTVHGVGYKLGET